MLSEDRRAPAGSTADGHVAALDGVRALAILLVMCVHAGIIIPHERGPGAAVMRVLGFGWAGVDLFFVLSGMLITGILLDTKGAARYYSSFYARRTLRIFPLYYAALAVLAAGVPFAQRLLGHPAPLLNGGLGLWAYTSNIRMAFEESWGGMGDYTFHFWSLAVEEQFYFVWPFLVARLSRPALTRVAAAMVVGAFLARVVLVAAGGHAIGLYVSTLTRMDALAAGALVAIAARSPGGLLPYRRFVAPVLAACGLGLAVLFALSGTNDHDPPLVATGGLSLLALGSAALLVGVLTAGPESRLRRALEAPWARHLGARSYGIYVWHVAVFTACAALVPALGAAVPWWAVRGLLVFALAVPAAVAVANVSWVVIEEPFLRLKRFVPRPAADGSSPSRRRPPPLRRREAAVAQRTVRPEDRHRGTGGAVRGREEPLEV